MGKWTRWVAMASHRGNPVTAEEAVPSEEGSPRAPRLAALEGAFGAALAAARARPAPLEEQVGTTPAVRARLQPTHVFTESSRCAHHELRHALHRPMHQGLWRAVYLLCDYLVCE